jgi:acyl carrier protein
VEEKIKQCFADIGIIIEGDGNFSISDYIEDSLSYVSLLATLEQVFEINIPDDYLVQGRLQTYQDICNMIKELSQK